MGKTDDPNHWDQPQPPPPPPSGFGRSNQGEEKPRGQGGGGGGTGSGTVGHAGVAGKQLVTIARSNHTHYVEHIKAIGERTKQLSGGRHGMQQSGHTSLHVCCIVRRYIVDGLCMTVYLAQ